ncbi:beta strand repeat-containing protein [Luminiphilus sp. nBUS_16]|uniref:beta strand repeat-containing protein n=1 Tax=Luminiphilus sp. nBUS_16 TaxID=3395315 RepID=UPI003EC01F52
MATASEIKITEAYIGLLGRAPDPAGLAYWVAEYDAAVAAGTDPDIALKKIANDFTIDTNGEWTSGLGANQTKTTVDGVTTITYTKTQADAVVNGMYANLFEKTSQSAADVKYWSDQLQDGSVTAAEMVVLLILGAGTTDAEVLGYKQEAASYYAETIADSDFSTDKDVGRAQAKTAVDAVQGPISLTVSKAATDAIASGTGSTKALTTGTDTVVVTGGDEIVTGLAGTGATIAAVDKFQDLSTTDSDSLTITGDGGFAFGTISNVENINVTLEAVTGAGFAITGGGTTTGAGSTINLTTAATTVVPGTSSSIAGEQVVSLDSLQVGALTTTTVTGLTIAAASNDAHSITGDASLATLAITSAAAGNDALTVALGNNDATLTVTAAEADEDSVTISAGGKLAFTSTSVENISVSGSGEALVVTHTGDVAADFTVTGDQDVTISAKSVVLEDFTLTDSSTAGKTSIILQDKGAVADTTDLTGAGTLSGSITTSVVDSDLIVSAGNTINLKTATDNTVTGNDASGTDTVTLVVDGSATVNTVGFNDVTIATNDSKTNTLDLDADVNSDISLTSGNDITLTKVSTTGAGNASFSAGVTGKIANTAVSLITTDGSASAVIAASGNITGGTYVATSNDANASVSITSSTGDVSTGAITLSTGADANDASATVTAANDVTITDVVLTDAKTASVSATAGNKLTINDVDGSAVSGGVDITLVGTANDVASGELTTTGGDVSITAGAKVVADAIATANGNVTITAGTTLNAEAVGADSINAGTGSVVLTIGGGGASDLGTALVGSTVSIDATGDSTNDVQVDDVSANAVVVSGSADVNLGTVDTYTLSASGATGSITANFDADRGAAQASVFTGSGNDNLDFNVAAVKFTVTAGDGNDSLDIVGANTGSTFNVGDGGSVIDVDDASGGYTITAGAGVDAIDLVTAFNDATISTGAGDDSLTLLAATNVSFDGGADTDTVNLANATSYDKTVTFANIEEIEVGAGTATVSAETFASDNVFKLMGDGGTLVVAANATTGSTIDASNVEFQAGVTLGINYTLSDKDDTVIGTELGDTTDAGEGNDTLTLGDGADIITGDDGADIIDVGADGDIDTVIYVAYVDGGVSGAADATTISTAGADVISNFDSGTDKLDMNVEFLAAAMDGATQAGVNAVAYGGNIDLADAGTGDDVAQLIAAGAATATAADLLTVADINTAVGTITNEVVADERIIVLNAQDGSSVMYYFKSVTADDEITADELQLLAVIDENIVAGDLATA